MIFHEYRLPADDSHEISCLICYFWKSSKLWNCRLLQIIGGTLWVKPQAKSSWARSLNFGLECLHVYTSILCLLEQWRLRWVYASSQLDRAFIVQQCNKCWNLYWAPSRENLSSGFPTKRYSNRCPQLQRLARKFKFSLVVSLDMMLSKKRIKKVLIRLRTCAAWSAPLLFVDPQTQVFLRRGPIVLTQIPKKIL